MVHKVFSVYDSKVGAYLPPFLMHAKGQAIRAFSDTANDASTQFCKHPEDFTLFEIAEYDDETGSYKNLPSKVSLGLAIEFKQQQTQPENKLQRAK